MGAPPFFHAPPSTRRSSRPRQSTNGVRGGAVGTPGTLAGVALLAGVTTGVPGRPGAGGHDLDRPCPLEGWQQPHRWTDSALARGLQPAPLPLAVALETAPGRKIPGRAGVQVV